MTPKKTFWAVVLMLGFALSQPIQVQAQQETDCPKRIGALGENFLSTHAIKIIKDVYQKLGCTLQVLLFPGRRSFVQFNSGAVDGELYRLPIGTINYTRPYVASEVPLFTITNSLWEAPAITNESAASIGYTMGVSWQKIFLDTHQIPGIAYRNGTDLINDYHKGHVTRFLAEDSNVRASIAAGMFKDNNIPIRKEVIKTGGLSHYLGAEFTPFMKRFSAYLIAHKPFAQFDSQ